MSKNRHIAPPVYLAEALSLPIEVTVESAFGTYTTTGVQSPYLSVPAGSYAWGDFVGLVAQTLAQYIFNDFAAAGSLPVNVGTVDNKDLNLIFTADNDYNASLVDFAFIDPSCTIGASSAQITACILKAGWPHYLGLGQEGDDVVCDAGGAEAHAEGLFQSRGIYTYLRSEINSGGRLTPDIYEVLPLGDGDIDAWQINSAQWDVEYIFVDGDFHVTGKPVHLGVLDSIGVDRLTLSFPNPKRTRVPGIEQTGLQTDRVVVGQYVFIRGAGHGWVSRVKAVTANTAPTKHTIELWDKVPAAYVVTTPSPVYKVSESWAMTWDSLVRTQSRILYYDADDQSGTARHTCEEWVLSSGTQDQLRRSVGLDRWSKTIRALVKRKLSLTPLTT